MSRDLGRRILNRRNRLGISQIDLAAQIVKPDGNSYTHGWLSGVEHGKIEPPAEAITALAVALGESPETYLRLAGRTLVNGAAPGVASLTLTGPQLEALLERAAATAVRQVMEERDRSG